MSINIIELTNGKRVANFSSPHPFTFEDGIILPAHSKEFAEKYKVDYIETPINDDGDVTLQFEISSDVRKLMGKYYTLYDNDEVDVVFCPLPMIQGIKDTIPSFDLIDSPFRSIRMKSRTEKVICIDKQCV